MDPSLSPRAGTSDAPAPPVAPAGGVAGGPAAAFAGATGWLNTPSPTGPDLRGRVVLVDFGTRTCIGWLRALPFVRAWRERYTAHGLVLIGVHTPEFDFEVDVEDVRRAVEDLRIEHPVALDADRAIWTAFGNRYRPALHLLDGHGRVRYRHVGPGGHERSERAVQHLLVEAGARGAAGVPVAADGTGTEAPADRVAWRTPDIHLGHDRAGSFLPRRGPVLDERHVYAVPALLPLDRWALSGDWTVRRQAVVLNRGGGSIAVRFRARELHLVMGPVAREQPVRFRVAVDGRPPGAACGTDVDGHGDGTVHLPRLHELVRQPGAVAERTLEITFLDPGVRAYAFTSG